MTFDEINIEAANNEDYRRGMLFAKAQIITHARDPRDMATYMSVFGGSADYDRGVNDYGRAWEAMG